MCILFVSFQTLHSAPVMLIANRDEYYERPTQALHWWQDEAILAGRDALKQGTWLGVNAQGRWAAVVNLNTGHAHKQEEPPKDSRGKLVPLFLKHTGSISQSLEHCAHEAQRCGRCHFIAGDPSQAWYFNNEDGRQGPLKAGMYALDHNTVDQPLPRLKSFRTQMAHILKQPTLDLTQALNLAATTQLKEDHEPQHAPFLQGSHFGTRSTSLILFKQNKQATFIERTYCQDVQNPYENHSQRAMRFRLTGAW